MFNLIYIVSISLITNFLLFKIYISISEKYKIYDMPDILNVHAEPTPTGSGIVILTSILITFLIFNYLNIFDINGNLPNKYYLFFFCISSLGIMSFIDDFKSIHPAIRLLFQFTIIFLALPMIEMENIFFPNVVKLNLLITLYLWVYLINIVNFTDGCDGFLAVNSITFFSGSLLFCFINNTYNVIFLTSLSFLPILLAYLYYNKPKAKIFMGDAGSITIGFCMGLVSFNLINLGYWDVVISLLSYTLIDCSLTIFNKMRNGNLPWARLFDYYFLKPIMKDKNNHKKVFLLNILCNFIILTIAVFQIILDLKILFLASILSSIIFINIYKKI